MSFKEPKRTLTWLLAVALLAGSSSLPGYQHTHAGGEVAHDHHNRMQQVVAHDDHHGHSHQHAAPDDSLTEQTSHVHWALFGFDLTLPASEDSDPDSSNSKQDGLASVVRIIGDCLRVSSDESSGLVMLACRQLSSTVTGALCDRLPKCRQPMAPSWLLCDAARHERSGVQLF